MQKLPEYNFCNADATQGGFPDLRKHDFEENPTRNLQILAVSGEFNAFRVHCQNKDHNVDMLALCWLYGLIHSGVIMETGLQNK